MAMHISNNKFGTKGFSLIEVVVALSILVMVLSGVITLIVSVVNLNLVARNKTEAVAFAQDGITIGSAKVSNGCFIYAPNTPELADKTFSGQNKYFRTISFEKGDMIFNAVDNVYQFSANTDGTFVRVISRVQWFDKAFYTTQPSAPGYLFPDALDLNKYELTQIVRNCND
jgi:prepilin-type N-terminal cleavage/methylation domain-containing protein